MKTVNLRKIRYFMRDYWSTVLTVCSLFVIFLLISFSWKSYKQSRDQLDILKAEVDMLKNRSDTLKYNKSLTEDQLVSYNRLLSALIPDSEDYFSMIYALETIAEKTEFEIVGYTINLSKSSPEKTLIFVEGRGNYMTFLEFLKNYEYAGGRLITSEKIEFSGVGFTNTRIALNFYSRRFAFNENVVPQLTKKDIEKLEEIKKKVQVTFKEDEGTDDTYETNSNPF